jgi:DNA-binding response OmpR family regulator
MAASVEQRAHIVVAEDDPEMRGLVAQCLRRDAHEVLEVGDGARLLVRIGRQYRMSEPEERIDLIVTDLRMPLITGLAILRGLRAAHCTTPVILMTAFGDDEIRREAAELRAVLLDKPFPMADLRATALELLGSDGARTPGSARALELLGARAPSGS